MTRRRALELLRRHDELLLVRRHWVTPERGPRDTREVLPVAAGDELVRAGLAVREGDRLRPA